MRQPAFRAVSRFLGGLLVATVCFGQPVSSADLESAYREAERAFQERRLDDAARGYERLAELTPVTAEIHAKLGLVYYVAGRFGKAIPSLRKAIELKPGLPNVGTLLAISLAQIGEFDAALPGLEQGFENPQDGALQRLVGLELQRAYLALDRTADAGRITARLTAKHPDDPEVLYHAGRFHAEMASTAMRRLVAIAPDSAWGHQASAEAFESRGNYALAIVEYRKALEKQPGRPGVHYAIARAIQSSEGRAGTERDALGEFSSELRVDPSNALAAYEAGEILRKESRYREARRLFDQAVSQRPGFGLARIGLGRVLRELGELEAARLHLEAATRLIPGNEVARYQLALVYRAGGDLDGAQREMAEFQRLRQRGPAEREAAGPLVAPPESTPQRLDAE